jgi:hypothetical protein
MPDEPVTYALFRSSTRSAVHLEMRDSYTPNDPDWREWRDGGRFDPAERWRGWFDLIADTTARGVQVRRARIVSEPVTGYLMFEYAVTAGLNIAAGEQVRWLPRPRAADLLVPAWVFDETVVVFNHFDGAGNWVGEERRSDDAVAKRCAGAFEMVWERAVPHDDSTTITAVRVMAQFHARPLSVVYRWP